MITPAKARRMTDAELRYTANDCLEALRAMPDTPNAGRYLDEIAACSQELGRRSK